MKKSLILQISFFTFFIISSGCSLIFNINTKSILKTKDYQQVMESYNVGEEVFDTIGVGTTPYTFNNQKDYYLIKSSKKRHKSSSYPITRTRFNNAKLIDIFVPLIADIVLMANIGNGNDMNPTAFFVGTLGWLGLKLGGPWRVYEKSYDIPSLVPIPERENDKIQLSVKRVGLDIKSGDHIEYYYDDFDGFKDRKNIYERIDKEKNKTKDLHLNYSLNNFLVKWNYRDTTKRILAGLFNDYTLSCDILSIKEHKIGSITSSEFKSKWKLYRPYKKEEIFTKEYTVFSDWTPHQPGKSLSDSYISALENSLFHVITDNQIINQLEEDKISFKDEVAKWDFQNISKSQSFASNIKEAVKAVVTIKTKNGHGSGCVISNTGLIVTNLHVIEGSSEDESVIILKNNNTIPYKILRSNSIYDLALLQVDSLEVKPLNLAVQKNIELGEEVYSIGTPSDIELGQTISRGIISGKRIVKEREYIQTDVSINNGNSGGALINNKGELVGVINAKIIGLGVEGLGFAIPSSTILESLKIKYTK